jgi:hypothetical protein
MTPHWLMKVLEVAAVLDLSHPDARKQLAGLITDAWPRDAMLEAALREAQRVLAVHRTRDHFVPGEVIAGDIARAVTQGVLGVLSVDQGGGHDASGGRN